MCSTNLRDGEGCAAPKHNKHNNDNQGEEVPQHGCRGCTKRRQNFLPVLVTVILLILSTPCSQAYQWGIDNPQASDSRLDEYNDMCPGRFFNGQSLSGGTNAGEYKRIGVFDTKDECAKKCCEMEDCSLALMLLSQSTDQLACFSVECYNVFETGTCKPIMSHSSHYQPALFHRTRNNNNYNNNVVRSSSTYGMDNGLEESLVDSPGVDLPTVSSESHEIETHDSSDDSIADEQLGAQTIGSKNGGTCQSYQGTTCANTLDATKRYYYSMQNPSSLDVRLSGPMQLLKARLTEKCFDLALEAICYRFYPLCSHDTSKEPVHICNDCEKLLSSDCGEEFRMANMEEYLKRVIRGCNSSPGDQEKMKSTKCIKREDVPLFDVYPVESRASSGDFPHQQQQHLPPSITQHPVAGMLRMFNLADEPSSSTTTKASPRSTRMVTTSSTHTNGTTGIHSTTQPPPTTKGKYSSFLPGFSRCFR